MPPPEVVLDRIAARERQHAEWLTRADSWARRRAGGGPVEVVYPRDIEAILALGVPCRDCLGLIYVPGVGGHTIRFGAAAGEHWAALISASCGRLG